MFVNDSHRLYRYMSFERFNEMLYTKKISANNPSLWPDQYELYWLRALSTAAGQKKLYEYIQSKVDKSSGDWSAENAANLLKLSCNCIYAICFSKVGDEELMWRANSDNNHAVMIETSAGKVNALQDNNDQYTLLLKDVEYVPDNNYTLETLLTKIHVFSAKSIGYENIDELFLTKRECFSYEKEARLLVEPNDLAYKENRVLLDIPCLEELIDGVKVHPNAKDYHVDLVKTLCEKNNISFMGKSMLYTV